jgi:TrmH family RNA methyltransferase
LALVAPLRFPEPRAEALASNAKDLLASARLYDTLHDALADCSRVYATTARPRALAVPAMPARAMAEQIVGEGLASVGPAGRIAVVFGRERTGLTNTELDHAQQLVVIPTGSEYASLNLAAAVQIVAYELSVAAGAIVSRVGGAADAPHVPVAQVEMERFYVHLERVLVLTRFLDPNNPRLLMRRLRRLFGRTAPDANEMNILRGILTSVEDSHKRK